MRALVYDHNFARVRSLDDAEVELSYDLDRVRWPWLALPPQHPVLIEKYQYFSAVTAVLAQRRVDPSVFMALTGFSWECAEFEGPAEYASCGVCLDRSTDLMKGFELTLYCPGGEVLAHARGVGLDLPDRDVTAWRSRSREKALAATLPSIEAFASTEAVGLVDRGTSFVSPMRVVDGTSMCRALVQTERAFHPQHAFHTGSGDHVNAGHLFDCALQAAYLSLPTEASLECRGGSAQFLRFTELDVPFEVRLANDTASDDDRRQLTFAFSQLGRETAQVSLCFE